MDLKQLHFFATIVQEGNITAAAARLHMAQPPLSHQMKQLEDELGMCLFARGARHITLTGAGEVFYKRALTILELTRAAREELEDMKSGERGTLRLGTVSSSGAALLKERMGRFHIRYPQVRFDIREENTYALIELLRDGIIEVAVVRTPFQRTGLGVGLLEPEPMVAAVRDGLFLAEEAGSCIAVEKLRGLPLIYYRRFGALIVACCDAAGFQPEIFCINDDARTSLMWADAGLGVAVVPHSALQIYRGGGLRSFALDCPQMETSIAVIWMKERYLSPMAQHFIKTFMGETRTCS